MTSRELFSKFTKVCLEREKNSANVIITTEKLERRYDCVNANLDSFKLLKSSCEKDLENPENKTIHVTIRKHTGFQYYVQCNKFKNHKIILKNPKTLNPTKK